MAINKDEISLDREALKAAAADYHAQGFNCAQSVICAMAPPTAAPWPSMYLVVECVTISAPHSMGRQMTGVGNVLSMPKGSTARNP